LVVQPFYGILDLQYKNIREIAKEVGLFKLFPFEMFYSVVME
tara:strand:- start:18328 stop:18453 length:126 start_codon:yes stop_codon:yes gene_type:complete